MQICKDDKYAEVKNARRASQKVLLFKKKNTAGFTLMEVLVALVVLAIAFSSVFMSISTNARSLLYLQNKTAANLVALNVIASARLKLINLPRSGMIANKAKMFKSIWYWSAVITPTPNAQISTIEVSVKENLKAPALIHVVGYLRRETST